MCKSCGDETKSHVDFCHLHNHSHYSLLDGMSSVKDLVKTAAELNYGAMALTDHGTCAGLYSFQKECKKANMKPILGIELYLTQDHRQKDENSKMFHLLLLAKNKIGMQNLFKLSSIAETEGKYYKPRIDRELLRKHSAGLICTSGCPASEIPVALAQGNDALAEKLSMEYKDIFGGDFYYEIMLHKYFGNKEQEKKERDLARKIFQLSNKFGIKALATNDIHYAKKSHAKYHDILLSMQTGNTIKNPDRFTFDSDEFYIKSYDEMLLCYKSAPHLLTNTLEVAEKVENDLLTPGADLLPSFGCPEGYASEAAYLKELVKAGMEKKGFINIPEYRERIKYEMQAIIKCGYTRYFLILWDIINFANNNGIKVGAGRGCFTPENKVMCLNGEKAICDIRIGDFVLAYDGKYHLVERTMEYDIEEGIIDIELEDGRVISCTKDHKIHVVRNGILEWVPACELTIDDDIYEITPSKL